MAKATRQQTTAVAGYDLTFTPVKSVSTLWAVADRGRSPRQIEDAHHAAVEATLSWLEREVLFTRRGRGGVQQVKAKGLIAGMFTHRDARSGDPHLHTHVAVSNKVQDVAGRWLAVDGRVLLQGQRHPVGDVQHPARVRTAVARLGVRFAAGARPAEESASGRCARSSASTATGSPWSQRRSAIEARRRELAADFQAGARSPTDPSGGDHPGQQATLQTRQAKHAARRAEQRRPGAPRPRSTGLAAAVDTMVERVIRRGLQSVWAMVERLRQPP